VPQRESIALDLNGELERKIKDSTTKAKEYIEDFVDYLKVSVPQIFNALLNNFETIGNSIINAVKSLKMPKFSSFYIAFVLGLIIFEIALEIVLFLFSGGAANVAKRAAQIRASTSAITKTVTKTITKNADNSKNIISSLHSQTDELIEAIEKGDLEQWVDDVVEGAGKKVDEAVDDVGKAVSKRKKILDDVESGKTKLDENADGTKRRPTDYTRHSNFAEMLASEKWLKMEMWSNRKKVKFEPLYKLIDDIDTPIKKGIDGIYENKLFDGNPPPPKYIIDEVKYNSKSTTRTTSTWRNTLSKTKQGIQMSDKWIEKNLFDSFDEVLAIDIKNNSYKILSGVSKSGNEIEAFRLSDDIKKLIKLDL
jgi:hypothetical protein